MTILIISLPVKKTLYLLRDLNDGEKRTCGKRFLNLKLIPILYENIYLYVSNYKYILTR